MKIGGGTKGKSFNDRELAGEVRGLALGHLKKILSEDYEDKEFQKRMLERLAPSLLPRLNELSGPNEKPIPLLVLNAVQSNNSNEENSGSDEEDTSDTGRDSRE